jgi:hypothetical protein|uniref:Uncharacterized protein n=2 Tax=root TaxID=1 RepID=A0A8S5SIJ8_9CAUD|nr:MAG: hypothetical protein [Bacteriophage sp.]DAE67214.1 MAG TPA: hypothetical protein [Caudoviricetes sp.]DAF50774.1 MAG TPA: hypothetical protein [Myoviridae sp. ct04y17]DAU31181.1 MAG TPA: hypothetical protein [Caudoviricetes sp.]DAY80236.1 MAG TPA: hypothetical protein [Caudoviricetes sp.]
MIIKDWALLWKYSWSYIQAVIMDQPKLDYHFEEKVKLYKASLTEDLYKEANKDASGFIYRFKESKPKEEHPDILLKDVLR